MLWLLWGNADSHGRGACARAVEFNLLEVPPGSQTPKNWSLRQPARKSALPCYSAVLRAINVTMFIQMQGMGLGRQLIRAGGSRRYTRNCGAQRLLWNE
jgi:hypothetical protein